MADLVGSVSQTCSSLRSGARHRGKAWIVTGIWFRRRQINWALGLREDGLTEATLLFPCGWVLRLGN